MNNTLTSMGKRMFSNTLLFESNYKNNCRCRKTGRLSNSYKYRYRYTYACMYIYDVTHDLINHRSLYKYILNIRTNISQIKDIDKISKLVHFSVP